MMMYKMRAFPLLLGMLLIITCYAFLLIFFQDVFPDKAMERKILSFTIRCPSRHCDWTGELRNKEVIDPYCNYKDVNNYTVEP